MSKNRKSQLIDALLDTLDGLCERSHDLSGDEYKENLQQKIEVVKQLTKIYEN